MIQLENQNSNELLEDLQKQIPTKFKINPTGVFFVVGSVCIVWKFVDVILFIIHVI